MNWQDKYTPEQLARIKKEWRGQPPAECTGNCMICDFIILWCHTCGFGEEPHANDTDSAYNDFYY